MKKLFLASIACITLDKVIEILPAPASSLKLAFIPTAANPYEDKSWLYKDRDKLVDMGFDIIDLDIENKSQEFIEHQLENIDVVFVSGGNTFYLLDKVNESGFDKVMKRLIKKGVVYIGSSAGSVLVCPTIEATDGLDDRRAAPNLKSDLALAIVDFLVFPHYGDPEYLNAYQEIMNKWKDGKYEIKTLSNNQALIINGDECRTIEVN